MIEEQASIRAHNVLALATSVQPVNEVIRDNMTLHLHVVYSGCVTPSIGLSAICLTRILYQRRTPDEAVQLGMCISEGSL